MLGKRKPMKETGRMIQGKESPDFLELGKRQGRFHIQSTVSTKPPFKGIRKSSKKLNIILELFFKFERQKKNIKQTKSFLKATDLKK